MKKKIFHHPRLYLNIFLKDREIFINYIDNNFSSNGKRLIQVSLLKDTISKNEYMEYLIYENRKQLQKLNNFLKTQKKVLEKYKKVRNYDKVKIIKNSMEILNEFKQEFHDWFKEHK